jgi:hypothetical protein
VLLLAFTDPADHNDIQQGGRLQLDNARDALASGAQACMLSRRWAPFAHQKQV